VNVDLSIHRMAFREAESLTVAQLLVAKKKAELDLRELRAKVLEKDDAARPDLDAALRSMEAESEALRHAAELRADVPEPHLIDKTA
jgi:non-ribosomal peptide synthetase component F